MSSEPGNTEKNARDPLAVALGRRLLDLRAAKGGLTSRELAARMGVSAAYMWRVEDGRQNLSLRNLARLAKALDVSLSELVQGIELTSVSLENREYGASGDNPRG